MFKHSWKKKIGLEMGHLYMNISRYFNKSDNQEKEVIHLSHLFRIIFAVFTPREDLRCKSQKK